MILQFKNLKRSKEGGEGEKSKEGEGDDAEVK